MKNFKHILTDLNDRINLPQPEKSRILLEISSDMEDLYNFHKSKGLSESDAKKLVEEKFEFDDNALSQLVNIHETVYRKFLNKLSRTAQTRWERSLLLFIVIFISIFAFREIFTTRFFLKSSDFIFPVIGFLFVIFILSVIKSYNLFIKKEHDIKNLRKGIPAILFFGILNLTAGLTGYFIEIYKSGESGILIETFILPLISTKDTGISINISVEWFLKISAMLMGCMLVTIFSVFIWFTLINKVIKIEQAEARMLLK